MITSIISIPLVVGIVMLGNPYLKYIIMLASLIGIFEFYRVVKTKYQPIRWLGYVAVIGHYIFLNKIIKYYFVYVAFLILSALIIMVVFYPKYSIIDVAITILPIFYISLLFSFLILVREVNNGAFWIGLMAISAWGSDTCAYFTGITLGKHKLAPELSPKKTVEGSIGGVVGAGLLGLGYTIIFTEIISNPLADYKVQIVLTVMLGAIISQIGDLAASAIKRFFKQKDYGHLLPGHGGILDRCDSFIFVVPFIYIVAVWIQNIIG